MEIATHCQNKTNQFNTSVKFFDFRSLTSTLLFIAKNHAIRMGSKTHHAITMGDKTHHAIAMGGKTHGTIGCK